MPVQLLHLPPTAYASTHDRPLSPRSKRAAKHLVRSYAGRSKPWWGTFIEVWDAFMGEVQRLGADPTTQLRLRHIKLMTGGQTSSVLWRGMR